MRSSTPKPKPVQRKIKKNVKRRPVRVPQHALERLPDDYIVVRGGQLSGRDPTGRPRDLGTPGLPVASHFNFRFPNRAFVSINNVIRTPSDTPAPSRPASVATTEIGYDTASEDYEGYYDNDIPMPPPEPPLAPAEPSAPPAPSAPPREDDGTAQLRAEIRGLQDELEIARSTVAVMQRVPPETATNETQTDPAPDPVPIGDGPSLREAELENIIGDLQTRVHYGNQTINELEQALGEQQHLSTERYAQLQAALFAETEQLMQTRAELAQRPHRPTVNAQTMTEQPEAPTMTSTGVGTSALPATASTGVGEGFAGTRDMETNTEGRRHLHPPNQPNLPDMRTERPNRPESSTRPRPNPRQGPTRTVDTPAEGEFNRGRTRVRPNPEQGIVRARGAELNAQGGARRGQPRARVDAAINEPANPVNPPANAAAAGAADNAAGFAPAGRGRGRGGGPVHNHQAAAGRGRGRGAPAQEQPAYRTRSNRASNMSAAMRDYYESGARGVPNRPGGRGGGN